MYSEYDEGFLSALRLVQITVQQRLLSVRLDEAVEAELRSVLGLLRDLAAEKQGDRSPLNEALDPMGGSF